MGNAPSLGGDRGDRSAAWPTRRTSNAAFLAIPDSSSDGPDDALRTATFGGGCYWGVEKWYAKDFNETHPGAVVATNVGFMAPKDAKAKPNPSYREVCGGRTGHVEVCQVKFDATKCSYEDLNAHLYTFHDPTTTNRQGNDAGSQYASVIFVHDEGQRKDAERVIARTQRALDRGKIKTFQRDKIVTRVEDATEYYPAESGHQRYLEKHPNGYCNHRRRFRWSDVLPGGGGKL